MEHGLLRYGKSWNRSRGYMAKVLIAEDDPVERDGLRVLLERSGFNVEAVGDGLEALERIRQERFDLLLVDLRMPRMNGLELLSRLPNCPPVKAIVITADDTAEAPLQALRRQAYQFVAKPFDPKQLIQLIQSALDAPPAPAPIEVVSAEPQWVELLIPCDAETVERIPCFLERLDLRLPPEVRSSVALAFHELLMNAVEWGGQFDPNAKVRIAWLHTERMVLCRIADPGKGFQFADLAHAAIQNPVDKPDQHAAVREEKGFRPGGLGISLARAMVDELLYNEAHNQVVMVKYLH